MAIVEGARGLLYWSFGEKGLAWVKDPREREQRWAELVRVTKEIKALEPVLLAPDAALVSRESSTGAIRTLGKRGPDGARYTGKAGPSVESGTLSADFGPYEVKRFRIR